MHLSEELGYMGEHGYCIFTVSALIICVGYTDKTIYLSLMPIVVLNCLYTLYLIFPYILMDFLQHIWSLIIITCIEQQFVGFSCLPFSRFLLSQRWLWHPSIEPLVQIKSLLGTKVEWLYYILEAFNSGNLVRYQELCHVHSAALNAQPALVENEKKLLEKINILCLMEIIFRYLMLASVYTLI